MATKKVKEEINEVQEINLDAQVTLRSIADWTTGFARQMDGVGDVTIPPKGAVRLKRSEIIAQVQMGNKLIAGIDGYGSHATLIIDDQPTRIELNFETADGSKTQQVFSDNLVKELFAIKTDKAFEKKYDEAIVTRAEQSAIVDAITRLKLNDYAKISHILKKTGLHLK